MRKFYIGLLSAVCLLSVSACGKTSAVEPADAVVESKSYVITTSAAEIELKKGETKAVDYALSGENAGDNDILDLKSSDSAIVTVDQAGEITGVSAGTAVISGYIGEKHIYDWTIVVSEPCVITCKRTKMKIEAGEMIKAESLYKVSGGNADDIQVELKTSDEKVASITDEGYIKGNSAGTATVTLVCGDAEPICLDIEVVEISISDVEKACKSLMKDLLNYEFVTISESRLLEVGAQVTIDLNDKEITRAAGMACPVDTEKIIDLELTDTGEYHIVREEAEYPECSGVELSEEDVNQSCRALFGRNADIDSISMEGNALCDVVKLKNGKIISLWGNYENELEFNINDSKIKKAKEGFVLEQELYHGYWGYNEEDKSNFKVIWGIERKKNSKYGYIITSMKITRIDDESTWKMEEDTVSYEDEVSPFYGIWCCGVKSDSEAQKCADDLILRGYDGRIFVTTDWSNLNSEKWYVVTAGVYDSKEAAKDALSNVKESGYPGAYVKYSGEYIGDQ